MPISQKKREFGTDTKIHNQDILTIMATKDIDLELAIVDLVIAIQIMPCWH
jgi:hypothetical protein